MAANALCEVRSMNADAPVQTDRHGSVAMVRLARPEHGNSITQPLASALADAVYAIDCDPSVRCVLLTGTGRFFCVGGDLASFSAVGDGVPLALKHLTAALHTAISRLLRMEKPVVVAVNGPAAGAGLGLAMLGDIVLGARSSHYSMAYTAVGLTPDGGTTVLLPKLVGLRRAQELTLTNRRVASDEAAAIGLITRVVEDDRLTDEAMDLAQTLSTGATRAIGTARSLLWSSQYEGLETQLELEARAITKSAAGSEAHEGLAAFLEKRTPMF